MVNIGTGNLIVQADDVDIKERGIDLAFRRSYNSQSGHNVANTDGSGASVFGNGWTNPFDARIAYNAQTNVLSIYDIDGARYDWASGGSGNWIPPAGMQGTSLTQSADGCGYQWTKKNGTTYLFWKPYAACGTPAGYYGRLYSISGRNSNNAVVLTYTWKTNAATIEDLASIAVAHSDGQSLTLVFASFGAYTELSTLTRPDGLQLTYSYDTSGNLLEVDRPGNNTSSVLPETYTYSGSLLTAVGTPRETLSYRANGGTPSDGEVFSIGYSGANVSTLTEAGTMNFVPADGTSAVLQASSPTSQFVWRVVSFTGFGSGTVSMTDTDGHATNWTVDGAQRITQEAEWTGSQYLVTSTVWDSENDPIAETDPRGNETDFVYDQSGNTLAVGGPQISTSAGTFRPTKLYSYDSFNNVVAYCDEVETNRLGLNWPAPSTATSGLCPSQSGATRYSYNYSDPKEPFGLLTDMWTPLAYHRAIAYATGSQGGDFGLPTSVVGDSITQTDGTTRQPTESFSYDAYGNQISLATGSGTWTQTLDSLNRVISRQDPDGVANYTCYYFDGSVQYTETASQHALDGSSAACQAATPAYAVGFQYDADGDTISETHHYGQTTSSGIAGVKQSFYDGADRLVEVIEPTTGAPFNGLTTLDVYPWLTRYIYDFSQGGTVAMQNGPTYSAHGGLYKTQRFVPGNYVTIVGQTSGITTTAAASAAAPAVTAAGSNDISLTQGGSQIAGLVKLSPSSRTSSSSVMRAALSSSSLPAGQWTDVSGTGFDALDRKVADYRYTIGNKLYTYDSGAPGLLVSEQNGVGDTKSYQYDADGDIASISFALGASSDSTYTPGRFYTYDPDKRIAQVGSSSFGSYTYTYDLDGRLTAVVEPSGGSGIPGSVVATSGTLSAASSMQHAYYGDALLESTSVSGGTSYTESYDYRADGLLDKTSYSVTGANITRAYSAAGRLLARQDPTGAESYAYDSYGRKSSAVVPSGTRNGYQYDVEDEPIQFTGPGYNGASQTFNIGYTATGEVGANQEVGGSFNLYFDGAPIQYGTQVTYDGLPYTSDPVVDTRNLLVMGQALENSSGTVTQTLSYAIDGAGRLTELQQWGSVGSQPLPNHIAKTYSYDAEDHTTQVTSLSGGYGNLGDSESFYWGPAGHPLIGSAVSRSTTWYRGYHWNGDELAFTNLQSGVVNDYKLGSDGDFLTADLNQASSAQFAGAIYFDRNDEGDADSSHSAAGHSGFCQSAGEYIYLPVCNGSPSGTTPAFYTSGFGPDMTAYSRDGMTNGFVTLQGARNYESATGQWTTPDAFEGVITDPRSQAKYMWNNNNPIVYSDPSGYQVEEEAEGLEGIIDKAGEALGKIATSVARASRISRILQRADDGSYPNKPGSADQASNGKNFKTPTVKAGECAACGTTTGPFHRDHIVPKARGGDGSPENNDTLCVACNLMKGNKTASEFVQWIRDLSDSRAKNGNGGQ